LVSEQSHHRAKSFSPQMHADWRGSKDFTAENKLSKSLMLRCAAKSHRRGHRGRRGLLNPQALEEVALLISLSGAEAGGFLSTSVSGGRSISRSSSSTIGLIADDCSSGSR